MEDDGINIYSQGPPSEDPLYVHVEEQYRYCYHENHGMKLSSVFVLPANRDLPGHSQDASVWDHMILYLL